MKFSDWLSLKGLNDEAAAKLLDCHRATVSRLRRGKSMPDIDRMAQIHRVSDGAVTFESWAREAA